MSVIIIDQFDFPSDDSIGTETYNIYFNNVSGALSVEYIGTDGEETTVTEEQRERFANALIGNFLSSDGLTNYEIRASLTTPFAYIDADEPIDPLPPSCDLAFTSVIATAETAQGANDGTVTAVATSTYGNIQYSLNGADWFSSGVFTGLAPANYTVSVRDDNDCTATSTVAIEAYNNPISGGFGAGLPVVTVSAGNVSKWSAAYNPIVINFQRNDNAIYAVADAGDGYVNITINGLYDEAQSLLATTTAVVVKGSKYKINQPAFSVTEVSGRSVLKFLSPYFGSDTGVVFIERTKPNYKIQLELTSGSTPYETTVVTGSWSPNLTGFVRADISQYLQSLVNAEDSFQYDVVNWKDANRGASYTLRYKEVWDGSDNPYYDAPYPMYVVYAAMQLGDKYGGNLAQFVPFYNEPNEDYKAKFLQDFIEPIFWVGLPFDISFIFSENIVGTEIKMRTTSLDINKQQVSGGAINSYLLNTDAGYLLGADNSRLIIQTGALPPVDEETLIEALGVNRLMMAGNPASGVEYFKVQLYRGSDDAPFFVTQPILIKTERPCSNDPYIYIKWINKYGGWNYYRFGYKQDYSLNVDNDTVISTNVFDWENDQTISDVVKKSANDKVIFGADGLSAELAKALKGIPLSIRVQVLISTNPIKWQTIIINPGSFDVYSTRGNGFGCKFTLNMPDINIQRQ